MVEIKLKWWLVVLLYVSNHIKASGDLQGHQKTFIVHMDKLAMPRMFTDHVEWYSSLVQSVSLSTQDIDDEQDGQRVIYTYESAFHGIAARLTDEEAEQLAGQNGVVSVLPGTKYELQTTRSPTFLGLQLNNHMNTQFDELTGHDVVVGVVDTGIWPESESFNDTGFKSVPTHWKGACEIGSGFEKEHCNKKLIGARSFYQGYEAANGGIDEEVEYKSPRDQDGHGTHTAATVAGSPVRGANLFGHAFGTAEGISPGARIAVYKVCWTGGCFSSDILSRFKGVNVKVEPRNLTFVKKYEKLSYNVTFTTKSRQVTPEFGGLIWNDGEHRVRSPIVINWLSS